MNSEIRIRNKEFIYCFCFVIILYSFFLIPNSAHAAIIIQAPKYIGLNSGLVGYWSFDGKDMAGNTAYDRSGNANNGTLTNGPARAIGKIGQGLSFDGTNDAVDTANLTTIANNVTISVWAKFTSSANYEHIFSGCNDPVGDNCTGADYDAIVLRKDATTNTVTFVIEYDRSGDGALIYTSDSAVPLGTWVHVAFSFDAANDDSNALMYVNGQSVSRTRSVEGILSKTSVSIPFSIGWFGVGNNTLTTHVGSAFNGLIDDVRIYNRALSGDEIRRLYRIGATLKINTSINNDSLANGLVGYWTMNAPDVAGTTAYDRSGNAKNGSALGQDISPSGLVGWWKLDDNVSGNGQTVADSSGQGNNGTTDDGANNTGMDCTVSGKLTKACDFDGVDDYVNMGNLHVVSSNDWAISVWVNPTTVDATFGGFVFFNGDALSTPVGGFGFRLQEGTSLVSAYTVVGTNSEEEFNSVSTVPLSTWTHIVVLKSGTARRIYLNGKLDNNDTLSSATMDYADDGPVTRIGVLDNNVRWFNGLIDDVRIYNRELSAAEVAQLYNYGLPKFAPAPGKLGQGVDSTQSYVNPGNVSSSVNSFSLWMKTASSSPTVNLLDLNASQSIKIVAGTVTASGLTSPSIFVDGVSGSTVNAGWHHIAVTTGTAVNASAVNLGLNATTTAPLDGVLDDVRFYNRVINNNEIKRLYRIGATLKINTNVSRDNPDLERGLVGLWSFDGKDMAGNTAYDRSGNGNNGTLTNGPTRAIGKIGQGLSFDGGNDVVNVGNVPLLDIGTGDYSAVAWIKANPQGASRGYLLFNGGDCATCDGFVFAVESDGGGGDLSVSVSNGISQVVNGVQGSVAVNDRQWHHVVWVWDRNVGIKFYIDGVVSFSNGTTNADNILSDYNFSIGDAVPSIRPFDGLIDDVRVYNRALSADEVKRLYNLGR